MATPADAVGLRILPRLLILGGWRNCDGIWNGPRVACNAMVAYQMVAIERARIGLQHVVQPFAEMST